MLIVISGLPGTGKTAVAAGIAVRLNAVHLSIDTAEDAMLGAGVPSGWETGVAAYEATRAAAEQNLAWGWEVVIDAVNDSEPARQTWRHAAERAASHCNSYCSPAPIRRSIGAAWRVDGEGSPPPEPTWDHVESRASAYEPWTDHHVLIDTYAPLETVIEATHRRLAGSQ